MTKENWIKHIEESEHCNIKEITKNEWLGYLLVHREERPECPECKARKKSREANLRAKNHRAAYRDLGMKRVRGSLGGVYYE